MERNDRTSNKTQMDIAVLALALVASGALAALVSLTIAVF